MARTMYRRILNDRAASMTTNTKKNYVGFLCLVIAGDALVSFVALNSAIWKGVAQSLPEEMAVSVEQHKIALYKNDV
jgi:hypothetical protein